MSDRVNARIDKELSARLDSARRLTGLSTTEILRAALERYCAEIERLSTPSAVLLERSGFIGCAEGPEDLAEQAKSVLRQSLAARH